jgi:hypothetical protein
MVHVARMEKGRNVRKVKSDTLQVSPGRPSRRWTMISESLVTMVWVGGGGSLVVDRRDTAAAGLRLAHTILPYSEPVSSASRSTRLRAGKSEKLGSIPGQGTDCSIYHYSQICSRTHSPVVNG